LYLFPQPSVSLEIFVFLKNAAIAVGSPMSSIPQMMLNQRQKTANDNPVPGTKGKNLGAYQSPVSGVGIMHDPDWTNPPPRGAVLHECGYLEENRTWNFTRVFSPFWRLYFNAEPGHSVIFDNEVIELGPDRIVVIPPHRQFHCRSTRPVPSLWVHFSISRKVSDRSGPALVFKPSSAEVALVRELIEAISEAGSTEPTDRNFRLSMALVLTVLSRREIDWAPDFPPHLIKAIRYLEENLVEDLTVEAIARKAGVGEARLRADFKTIQGTTPGKYLTEIRVREAAAMLAHPNKSIDEIAEACGFGTRFYLSRVFKKITGESPAAYRRKHRA
jgi:AraC family transcriptional regulator, arabinose operon regulatory protein